jgi:uncharacterized protein involved in exopolysaccharide biosynthesis
MADLRVEADRGLAATDDLRELRKRLAELDAERAEIERKIEARLAQIGTSSPSEAGRAGLFITVKLVEAIDSR